MTRQINLGFVGCGKHNLRGHALPALARPDRFRIAALSDPAETASAWFARQISNDAIERVVKIEELLEIPWIDAVVIGSPDRFHAEQTLAAVQAGKHVLVDKPAATTRGELALLSESCEIALDKNLVLTSCHPRRFNPPYVRLKEFLREEDLGEPLEIALDFSYPVSDEGKHEGLMIDHVSHEFDYVRWLFGEEARAYEIRKVFDAQDRYHAVGTVEAGHHVVALNFTGSRFNAFEDKNDRVWPEWIRIRFAQGDLELETLTGRLRLRDHCDGSVHEKRFPATDYGHAFGLLMEDFHLSVVGGASYLTVNDVYRNSEIGVELMRKGVYRLASDFGDLRSAR